MTEVAPTVATKAAVARWRWSIGYYAALAVWLVVVYQQWFEDLVGVPASRWFWKANEVYLVALAVPLYWDLVATRRRPDGVVEHTTNDTPGPSPLVRRVVWYSALVVTLALFEGPLYETLFGDRVPQRIITLRDVIVGLLALSLYFDWSRGLWRTLRGEAPRMVSVPARLAFFAVVLAANIAIFQEPVKDLLGFRIYNALDFHAEAFAVVFFVPIYFDVILPLTRGDAMRAVPGPLDAPRRNVVLALWIGAMLFFLWIGQGAARSWIDNGFGQWFVRSPEPPLAAILFTVYFEVVRRLDGVRSAHAPT